MSRIVREREFVPVIGLVLCLTMLGHNKAAPGAAWLHWRRANRDDECSETGLLKSWLAGGPKLPWEVTGLGPSWSHLVIVDGRLYVRHSDVLLVYDVKAK